MLKLLLLLVMGFRNIAVVIGELLLDQARMILRKTFSDLEILNACEQVSHEENTHLELPKTD